MLSKTIKNLFQWSTMVSRTLKNMLQPHPEIVAFKRIAYMVHHSVHFKDE